MRNTKATKRLKRRGVIFACFVVVFTMAFSFCSCGKQTDEERLIIKSAEDYHGLRIGTMLGSYVTGSIMADYPDSEISFYDDFPNLVNALLQNKIDVALFDNQTSEYFQASEGFTVDLVKDPLYACEIGYIFEKSEKTDALRTQVNEYIAKIKASGEHERIVDYWFNNFDPDPIYFDDLENINGSLKIATDATTVPMTFHVKDGYGGVDLDIIHGFCKEYGYAVELSDISFTGMLLSVQSGKYDIGASDVCHTEERAQSVNFSDSYYDTVYYGVIRWENSVNWAEHAEETPGFFDTLRDKFEKTFVTEARWKMFMTGIGNTLVITLISAVLGLVLGYFIYCGYHMGSRLFNGIINALTNLLQGVPMVVIVLVFFYVFFAKSDLSGLWVSVLAFTVVFTLTVVNLIRKGMMSVPGGQTEAAAALGYTKMQSFTKILFPQAVPYILPNLKSELINHIKATAIVGYISVWDLTKVSDIVRARTFEAMFPLFASALIYYLMTKLLAWAVNAVAKGTDPKRRREKSIPGVKGQ